MAVKRYKPAQFISSPYTNSGDNWVVCIGCGMSGAGTRTANSNPYSFTVKDAQSNVIDSILIQAENYVAVPTTQGMIYLLYLPKKLYIPPGGSLTIIGISGFAQLIEAQDTTSVDGKDSLENALAIK